MRRSSDSRLDLNFDGLTDALTNLVGTLIMFVFMLVAISQDALTETLSQAEQGPPQLSQETLPLDGLLRQVATLRAEAYALDEQIDRSLQEIPRLQQRLERLDNESAQDNRDKTASTFFSNTILAQKR